MLADRSGALAQVATVIGLHGGNITSIDVLTAGGDSAIDDVTVDFSHQPDMAELSDDLTTNAGARLLSLQPGRIEDPVEASLRLAISVLGEDQTDGIANLARGLANLTSSSAWWHLSETDVASVPAAHQAVGEGRITPGRSPSSDLPGQLGSESAHPDDQACVLAIPVVGGGAMVLARSVPNDFTATEVSRVEAFTTLYQLFLTR
jgi:hypothetical protein